MHFKSVQPPQNPFTIAALKTLANKKKKKPTINNHATAGRKKHSTRYAAACHRTASDNRGVIYEGRTEGTIRETLSRRRAVAMARISAGRLLLLLLVTRARLRVRPHSVHAESGSSLIRPTTMTEERAASLCYAPSSPSLTLVSGTGPDMIRQVELDFFFLFHVCGGCVGVGDEVVGVVGEDIQGAGDVGIISG